MAVALYPGSFDPVTMGHLDVIKRSAKIFAHVYVAVAVNSSKQPVFSTEQRIRYLQAVTRDLANVEVITFNGLLVEAARKYNARIVIKGLRANSDFEFEFQMALMNKKLAEDVETLFMATNTSYSYLSSSLVKEVAKLGGCIKDLVPPEVHDEILRQLR
ncbi:MAG TPA: pantetheine-phosphate adenylyltransferase [Bacillota bacterium]|nr:pantetheine-phosphate adenylyltransferase [Bacillota bacterium]HPZ21677.1 pantetheine-phosphate adenylyltransferase [Bacillota bacterium]HQD19514.1 pantetheine-phosphate adenylyltransferase [Bacillota bacterium]